MRIEGSSSDIMKIRAGFERVQRSVTGGKHFIFCNAIIVYHYLSRNPKFVMETFN